MDPFSLTAGTLGIAGAALQSINALIHDIKAIRDAPDVLASLKYELAAVEAILLALDSAQKTSKLDHLTDDARQALKLAVTNCQKASDNFGMKLARWTKRSDAKMRAWERVHLGVFAERSVEKLCQQLNRYESTLNIAISTVTLLSVAASDTTSEAIQREICIKETELTQEIIEINNQKAVSEKALQSIAEGQLLDDPQYSTEAIQQLQDQDAGLDNSRKLLEELLAEVCHVSMEQTITNVDISDGGKLLVGLVNTDDDNGEVRQEIHNVKATSQGKGIVGMAKGFDVNAFFKN
ncbi:uncharacterized protein N7511_007315 [Penicillium nucicola]|uniref:uncharacterized protein n=1 Tax=Penicillium nucicola TaxID=1850975 RepID=UPI0025450B22|nr:uncharacterized protein N7511_007315 [Penicillium nucicola]KAJ5757133.1 hypothetical protein N7511_007315 [Penicillium nucicola]